MRRPSATRIVTAGLLLGVASQAGCVFFDPLAGDVRLLRSRVTFLSRRIEQLEQDAGVGAATAVVSERAGAAVSPTTLSGVGPGVGLDLLESSTLESVPASAPRPWWRWPHWSISRKAWGKLGRGLTNMLTGWVEIPKRTHETSRRSGAGAGVTAGVLRGFGYGFIRTAAGAYETLTFPVPAPPDYRPLMRPAYVFTCEHDEAD